MAQSPASFKWLTISIQGHYTWDLWWTMLNWDRILSQYFSFLCQYPATIVPRPFTHLSLTSLGPISRQRRYTQHITRDPLIRIYVLTATDSYWRLLTATDSPGHSWLENLKIRKIWSIVFVTLHVTALSFTCYCVTFYMLLRDVLHVAVWRFTRAVWHVQPTILYQHASRLLEDTCRSVLEASRNYNSVSAIDGPHRDVLT